MKTKVNELLRSMNLDVIDGGKFRTESYKSSVLSRINDGLAHVFDIDATDFELEIFQQLQEKYNEHDISPAEKNRILSILPKSWSVAKITGEFPASRYKVEQVKKFVDTRGILFETESKAGKSLDERTVNVIREFYLSDELSRKNSLL